MATAMAMSISMAVLAFYCAYLRVFVERILVVEFGYKPGITSTGESASYDDNIAI
jgi:hypothetical protein